MIKKTNAKQYFRSFEEFIGSSEQSESLNEVLEHDFAQAASQAGDGLSRRRWMQLMGASMAFGSMVGCRMGKEQIAPFVFRPHNRIPGVPEKYATSVEFAGVARPLLATCVDGRPIKLDGNADHPSSGSGTDAFTQAMILDLYDPDRSRSARIDGKDADWESLLTQVTSFLGVDGRGVAVLAEPTTSPTANRLKQEFMAKYPQAAWYEFTSISNDNERAATKLAFGKPLQHRVLYDQAQIIVTLDADPLGLDPNAAENVRRFTAGRDPDHKVMNRLYAVESKMSTTGAMADHQISLRLSKFSGFVGALERAIDAGAELDIESASTKREKVFAALVNDLLENKGKSVVVCGYRLPAEVQAQVCRINHKLGSYGSVLEVREVPDVESGLQQLSQLNGDIAGAKVDTLLVLGANPVYTAPADLKITETLSRVKNLVHFGLYFDETAAVSGMHGNLAHPLETWGDYLAVDGSWLISQPLIEPLFGAKSTIEILARLIHGVASPAGAGSESHSPNGGEGHNANSMFEVVKATAQAEFGGADFDKAWNQAVHDGFIVRQVPSQSVSAPTDFDVPEGDADWARDWEAGELELVFVPSSHVYDGRFANNGWMQELPDFLTKLTWDNAALVSPKTARVLGLQQGRMAVIDAGTAGSLSLPVNILPGMANGCVAVELGYGRLRAGRVGGDASRGIPSVGHDVGVLRTTKNWNTLTSVRATPTATKYKLATTQEHFRLDALGQSEINRRAWGETGDSALFREGNYANYLEWLSKHGDHGDHDHDGHADDGHGHGDHHGPERWPSSHHLHFKNVDITPRDYDLDVNHKWGMSIDLNKCIGCNACVIACQAENNIPIVGKESVARGRELHWMRIDRYFVASNDDVDVENLHVVQQPVTCMHCENAPCETVCPVAATVHSNEGLNDMVYNRCVGTRYCGNNCPYKVRRFNYLNYSGEQTFIRYPNENPMSEADRQLQNLVMNPEVTLRTRGVMEKCTYCVQRIQNGKILAKNQDRKLRPNEIEVACQQACPAQAIEFGDLHLKDSRVTKAHDNHRAYVLLEELNIYPRTKYLARVRNPHPALESLFKLG